MSALADGAASYLELRRALGFKLDGHGRVLAGLVAYLDERGIETLTAAATIAWAGEPVEVDRRCRRLGVARSFAAFMLSVDPATQVPPKRLWPRPRRTEPFVCSPAEIAAVVDAAGHGGSALVAATFQTVVGLIAATGMRVGEVLGLDTTDVDLTAGVLTVRDTKFGKSREVAVHPTAVTALTAYARVRHERFPTPVTPGFFVAPNTGHRLSDKRLWSEWHRTIDRAGITRPDGRQPRLHDLRHSFAVNTMRAWHDAGLDVEVRLPLLSTYLGHANPASTYWYLTATPDLLAAAARRLETSEAAS